MRRLLLLAAVSVFVFGCNLSDPEENNRTNNTNNSNNVNNINNVSDTGNDTRQDVGEDDMTATDMGPDSADMGLVPMTLDDFCAVRGIAYSRELFACYSSGPYPDFNYDPARPDAALRWGQDCWAQQAYIDAGTVVYDPVEARRCADALEALNDGTCHFGDQPHIVLEECQNVLIPQQNTGDDCHNGFIECADGYCDQSGGICPGTCRPFAQPGEACDTFPCDFQVANCNANICVARAQAGSPCTNANDCLNFLCLNNVCVDVVDYGEACDVDNPCRVAQVVNGDTLVDQCNNGTCSFKSVAAGDCLYDYQCPVGTYCERPDQTVAGVCEALPVLGRTCGNGYACAADLYCAPGTTCEPASQNNELCDTVPCGGQPGTLFCSPRDNRCHPQGIRGALCDPNRSNSCIPGLICQASTSTCADSAADGQSCRPYSYGYGVGFNAPLTPPCEAGLACRCDPAQPCTQGNNNDPHICMPFTPPAGAVVCSSGADCANNEYCGQNNNGLPLCTGGTCQLR